MNNIEGAIFDCDGTLLDSIDVWRGLEYELADRAGVVLTPEEEDELVTLTIPEVGDMFHGRFGLGETVQDVLDDIHDYMLDFYGNRSVLLPGAAELVRALNERGIPCTVASSTPRELLEVGLSHVGLRECFQAVYSVDDVGHSKREPHVFHACADCMGSSVSATWGFEDSVYAINTLSAAGFRTLGVFDRPDSGTPEQLREAADIYVESLADIDGATFPRMPIR